MVDITRDKPIKVAVRVQVPVRDHPKVRDVEKVDLRGYTLPLKCGKFASSIPKFYIIVNSWNKK